MYGFVPIFSNIHRMTHINFCDETWVALLKEPSSRVSIKMKMWKKSQLFLLFFALIAIYFFTTSPLIWSSDAGGFITLLLLFIDLMLLMSNVLFPVNKEKCRPVMFQITYFFKKVEKVKQKKKMFIFKYSVEK